MPYVDASKNLMLDQLAANAVFVSLHTAFPGLTGADEVSGGSYARHAITWNTASAGNLDSSNTPVIPVPAGATVEWIGYFSLVTIGVYYGYSPLNAAPFFYTVDTTGDTIDKVAHGLVNDNQVVFYGGSVPGGLVEGTIFFVVNATSNDFQVAATQGGSAIVLTSTGDFNTRASIIVPETFAAAGNLTISDADLDLNL